MCQVSNTRQKEIKKFIYHVVDMAPMAIIAIVISICEHFVVTNSTFCIFLYKDGFS